MADRPKRQTLQLDISQAARQSLSIARLHDRFKGERTSIVKRALITDTLRGGSMVEEAGLSSVFAFLDTQKFDSASEQEKQRQILQALLLRLDVEPVSMPAAAAIVSSAPQALPPATEVQEEPVQEDSSEEEAQEKAAGKESGAVNAVKNRFSKLGSA